MAERTFDRIPFFDPRSREYPIRSLFTASTPRSYTWSCNTFLDQGREGACVGFAWAHEAAARPKVHTTNAEFARLVYKRAQELDEWAGEHYDGTSVLAGAKTMKEKGYLTEYRWAFGLNDALVAISRQGPAVLGVNWYSGMWDTDNSGFIHASGEVVGGHAILATGVNVKGKYVTLHNSWGPDWGVNGKARISFDDLDKLLGEYGEACVPVVR